MQSDLIEALWDERQRMYRIAFTYMQNDADALDVVSETYAKAVANQAKIRELKYAKTWLTRILINTALDQLRKRKPVVDLEQVMDEPAASSSSMELLFELPDEYRVVVFLRFVEDLQLKEIAEVLELPLSTVKHRLYRGLELLRIVVEDLEEVK